MSSKQQVKNKKAKYMLWGVLGKTMGATENFQVKLWQFQMLLWKEKETHNIW